MNGAHAPGTAVTQPTADPPVGLGARQAALVAALVGTGTPPAGFDVARLAATRRALLRKRAGLAAREWPLLAAAVGAAWPEVFARYRSGHPPVGGLRDGWHVARELAARGELSAPAATELADREALLRYDGRTAPRPRRSARIDWLARRWRAVRELLRGTPAGSGRAGGR